MKILSFIVLSALVCIPVIADEAIGRAGLKALEGIEIETEFYWGRHGYRHAGIGLEMPLDDRRKLGITGHAVREEFGASLFPSLGAEFIQELSGGLEVEIFTFHYLPVDRQRAWALGVRANRKSEPGDGLSVSPFFGPAYSRVKALDEDNGDPVDIGHLMLMAGVVLEGAHFQWTVVASHSLFSRDPSGLETHVDLEEMTHFGAYENNDGFARHTIGTELTWSTGNRLKLTGRYAIMFFDEETRHSFSFGPSLKITQCLDLVAGFQFIRGGDSHNDIFTAGLAVSF